MIGKKEPTARVERDELPTPEDCLEKHAVKFHNKVARELKKQGQCIIDMPSYLYYYGEEQINELVDELRQKGWKTYKVKKELEISPGDNT